MCNVLCTLADQSSLSQQLGQMHSLEKQGEAILEALVSRLKKELQSEPSPLEKAAPPPIPPKKFPLTYRYMLSHTTKNENFLSWLLTPNSLFSD
jgi:hypothetical protein